MRSAAQIRKRRFVRGLRGSESGLLLNREELPLSLLASISDHKPRRSPHGEAAAKEALFIAPVAAIVADKQGGEPFKLDQVARIHGRAHWRQRAPRSSYRCDGKVFARSAQERYLPEMDARSEARHSLSAASNVAASTTARHRSGP